MPIYEYICRDCGHELEALQRLSDDPLSDCPACETASLQKKVSAAGFRLKGGGWYETDFKSGGKRNLAGDSSSGSSGSSGGAGGSGSSSAGSDASSGSSSTPSSSAA
ncbi:MAG: zinc ribbon domain-containing protein [Pseudomonadota bacterium]|nr:zinc ribbon domain-containing protein [Pseudomonadota bacterium]